MREDENNLRMALERNPENMIRHRGRPKMIWCSLLRTAAYQPNEVVRGGGLEEKKTEFAGRHHRDPMLSSGVNRTITN